MHWHLDVTLKEDRNTTLDKTAAQNLNIINKWCLSILKLFQIGNKKISMRKKRFCISMKAEEYLEKIVNLKKILQDTNWDDKNIYAYVLTKII